METGTQSRILELAAEIQHCTQCLHDGLVADGQPLPSWELDTPPAPKLSLEGQAHQDALFEAMHELQALILGPVPYIFNKALESVYGLLGLHFATRFSLASSFPPGTTTTFATLADQAQIPESDVARYLRFAMTDRVFAEPSKGVVAHTPASKALASSSQLRAVLGHLGDEIWPSACRAVDAIQEWPGSEEPTQCGFSLAHDTDKVFFDDIKTDERRARRFAESLELLHQRPGFQIAHVLRGYDWGAIPFIHDQEKGTEEAASGVVVDVGGSTGTLGIALADAFPNLKRVVVQDLAPVTAASTVPDRLQGRLEFETHDFFADQTVKGADAYFLRWVLHDWSDHYAVRILRALVPAMREGSQVVVNEFCMPEPGELPPYQEKRARFHDLGMKQLLNAKERSKEDWKELFKTADERFTFQYISKPHMSELSLVVFEWRGSKGH
ncbi:hypothetical protein G7Y89_g9561 [Cudoniella acicularis]|uniref:O-methyltransferase C-terminal domain-containing protein n=1 Tax=Cudoniella acicularis TaxID=354080 RepID=A0A8H4RGM6_9HELO|nr:hypothetical protein G7Y89_g9561 [Cudoniella acicularis]